ncbi:hypothetical protein ASPTUDRAFT_50394 [Aspergillus tubingensis CBS 134.48]|uniref:Uncharacterized protein n=1 Tax=Aspergillus tubingensis (strain CBS 134.48) TaxID=767770 RepID=A0A1L9NGQ7_ASPTC|nr:hypothetical protein ASPTUDRAFT_50394 [Aspergillus tubingensis CBS 134.48]
MAIAIPKQLCTDSNPKRSRFLSVTCPKLCCAHEENSNPKRLGLTTADRENRPRFTA